MSGFSSPPLLDPYSQQLPAPPFQAVAYTAHSGHGSVGPVIGVLAVITILASMAVMIGRLCSGRRIMGRGMYDFEGWVESKCGACIDGRVDPPPPPRILVEHTSSGQVATAAVAPPEEDERGEEEEVADNHQHERV